MSAREDRLMTVVAAATAATHLGCFDPKNLRLRLDWGYIAASFEYVECDAVQITASQVEEGNRTLFQLIPFQLSR